MKAVCGEGRAGVSGRGDELSSGDAELRCLWLCPTGKWI